MQYEINISYKCDLRCPYCAMLSRLNSRLEEQEVLELLKQVKDGSEVTLSGGEPGLCKKEFIFSIFRILLDKKVKINVNTNGMFIRRYKHLLKFLNIVNFHTEITTFKKLPFKNINYVIILTKNNSSKLEPFLKEIYNKFRIKFDIIPCTNFLGSKTDYTSNINVLKFSKFMTEKSIKYFLKNDRYMVTYLN